MAPYDELTHRAKHELRELGDGPRQWLEHERPPGPWSRFNGWHLAALFVGLAAAGALLLYLL